jgi:hypothetical protein
LAQYAYRPDLIVESVAELCNTPYLASPEIAA